MTIPAAAAAHPSPLGVSHRAMAEGNAAELSEFNAAFTAANANPPPASPSVASAASAGTHGTLTPPIAGSSARVQATSASWPALGTSLRESPAVFAQLSEKLQSMNRDISQGLKWRSPDDTRQIFDALLKYSERQVLNEMIAKGLKGVTSSIDSLTKLN